MVASRHTAPMFVDVDNVARSLAPVRLGQDTHEDRGRREAFIQNLVHDHPALIPMTEIEPAFSPLISVCREMPKPAGYVDNLWLTPWGGLVLGEAKLVRNPQARREVVVQTLDYARAIVRWGYEDLQRAVRQALKQPQTSLWDFVRDQSDLDEAQFVDAVERRLRTSQFLLLIIGDGIQEGVEALTGYLQLHAGLHVGLALLDLSLWRDINGGIIVVPRIPMRTVLIERGIVRMEPTGLRIDGPEVPVDAAPMPVRSSRPVTQSETEYLDQLSIKRPELAGGVKAFLGGLGEIGVTPTFGASAILRFTPGPNTAASAGYIETSGKIWVGDGWSAANRAGNPTAGEAYLASVAALSGGQIKRYERSPPQVVDQQGRGLDVAILLARSDGWKRAIADLVMAMQPD